MPINIFPTWKFSKQSPSSSIASFVLETSKKTGDIHAKILGIALIESSWIHSDQKFCESILNSHIQLLENKVFKSIEIFYNENTSWTKFVSRLVFSFFSLIFKLWKYRMRSINKTKLERNWQVSKLRLLSWTMRLWILKSQNKRYHS